MRISAPTAPRTAAIEAAILSLPAAASVETAPDQRQPIVAPRHPAIAALRRLAALRAVAQVEEAVAAAVEAVQADIAAKSAGELTRSIPRGPGEWGARGLFFRFV
jgi:hypothetical protein